MTDTPTFIDIDSAADIEDLAELYQEKTDSKLYPAQDAKALIQIMAYYGALIKNQFNEAAKLNLVQYSSYPILDFLGGYKGVERLEDEDDDSYRERILLAPESYSVAGPALAYEYFCKSADSSIVDVKCEVPDDTITVDINGTAAELSEISADDDTTYAASNDLAEITASYQTGTVQITLNEALAAGSVITVTVPRPYKTNIYVLTESGEADNEIIEAVENILSDDVIPLCDYPVVQSAEIVEFEISGTIYITKDADLETVESEVNEALNTYLETLKGSLKKAVVLNQIIATVVEKIEGVHDFKLDSPTAELPALSAVSYAGTLGALTYERVDE
ncbi:MAG: baseplate J/gp47 family protein [Candidatus Gastranaerophilales bacterium]|nr:baseplate J/gp47 family protein [Candidatus Gastranaerophilales bacterium]